MKERLTARANTEQPPFLGLQEALILKGYDDSMTERGSRGAVILKEYAD